MNKNLTREKRIRQNMIFNTVGSLIYYACQWLMTILIARILGYEEAGVLSIAMSVTASPAIVGLFNIRSFQVSDLENQFSDEIYILSRIYTTAISFVICIIMVILGGYDLSKKVTILIYMIYKIVEGFADVYYGVEQKNERMDYVGISLSMRGVFTLVSFYVTLKLTNSLFMSIVTISIVSASIVAFYDKKIVRKWECSARENTDIINKRIINKRVISLLGKCFPLAVVAFLNNLSLNIPKIYLEKYYGSEIMGIYSSVSSPTLVVQLAATTIFAPLIPVLSLLFKERKKELFCNTIKKLALIMVLLSIVCLAGAKLFGRWGLVLLFKQSIEPYAYMFVPITGIAIMIAINASLFSMCTLMREIKSQYLIGVLGILSSYIFSITVVKEMSMVGTTYAFVGSLFIQILIQIMIIYNKIKKYVWSGDNNGTES